MDTRSSSFWDGFLKMRVYSWGLRVWKAKTLLIMRSFTCSGLLEQKRFEAGARVADLELTNDTLLLTVREAF